MARGQAAPSVFPEHAEYAPLLCDILRGGLTWLYRSGGLSHARRLLPESGRRAALLHAKRVWGGRAVRHAQPAKPAKRRKEDNLGHAKSREPHPRTVSCTGRGKTSAEGRKDLLGAILQSTLEELESDKFVQENGVAGSCDPGCRGAYDEHGGFWSKASFRSKARPPAKG